MLTWMKCLAEIVISNYVRGYPDTCTKSCIREINVETPRNASWWSSLSVDFGSLRRELAHNRRLSSFLGIWETKSPKSNTLLWHFWKIITVTTDETQLKALFRRPAARQLTLFCGGSQIWPYKSIYCFCLSMGSKHSQQSRERRNIGVTSVTRCPTTKAPGKIFDFSPN